MKLFWTPPKDTEFYTDLECTTLAKDGDRVACARDCSGLILTSPKYINRPTIHGCVLVFEDNEWMTNG